MKLLTPPEIADFEKLEKVIGAGHKTFVAVGLALTEIRDRKLYQKDFDTFEAYCQKRWGWTRIRAHQLIEAADVVESLTPNLLTMVNNERVARELGKIPAPEREKVIEKAVESGEPLTALSVRKHRPPPPVVSAPKTEPAKPTPPPVVKTKKVEAQLDKTGWPIPQTLLLLWERAHEVQEILTSLSRIKGALRGAQENKDKLFVEVNFGSALAQLDQAYADVKTALPFAVCPTCQGKSADACQLCKGRGFISEHRWSTVVPKETKELRLKARNLKL